MFNSVEVIIHGDLRVYILKRKEATDRCRVIPNRDLDEIL